LEFVYQNPEIEQALAQAGTLDALNDVLKQVADLVPSFMAPEIRGRAMFSPGLDAAAPKIACQLKLDDIASAKSNENVCIVATGFYPTGGHSRVAADISQLTGAAATSVILTDIYRQRRYSQFIDARHDARFRMRSAMVLSAATLVERIVELYMLLAAIRPTRIFLMQNHMDMVAVAAVWPFRDVVEYVHHADHLPTLGATLPFSSHVDLTYTCHLACKEAGVSPVYAGLSASHNAAAVAQPAGDGRLRIATCGALHKYRQPPARRRWIEFVVAGLQGRDAELIHIGPFDEGFAAEMRDGLTAAGIDPSRYRFTGPVPDLREALVAQHADIYVSSFPENGTKADLEAMTAGIATIVPIADDLPPLLHFESPLSCWIRITEPSEMPAAIERALALQPQMSGPEIRGELRREFGRFENWVTTGDPELS
jgi:hypothetical protein